jgi:hypothetical protein
MLLVNLPGALTGVGRSLVKHVSSYTLINFMWLCKQHKVYLLYLPPYALHLLQPLNLALFSVLKSRYSNKI